MPQATDEQRALMEQWFGNPIDDGPPWRFLVAHGYTAKGGMIIPPVPSHRVSYYEGACIDFLCDEWDYGFVGYEIPEWARP